MEPIFAGKAGAIQRLLGILERGLQVVPGLSFLPALVLDPVADYTVFRAEPVPLPVRPIAPSKVIPSRIQVGQFEGAAL